MFSLGLLWRGLGSRALDGRPTGACCMCAQALEQLADAVKQRRAAATQPPAVGKTPSATQLTQLNRKTNYTEIAGGGESTDNLRVGSFRRPRRIDNSLSVVAASAKTALFRGRSR